MVRTVRRLKTLQKHARGDSKPAGGKPLAAAAAAAAPGHALLAQIDIPARVSWFKGTLWQLQ